MQASNNPGGVISRGEDVAALARHLMESTVIAIDAEMDSYFSYQTKLCLIQISTPEQDFLIDPLTDADLSCLQGPLCHPGITKILHAGDNDVPFLVERIGGRVEPIFDTHVAARVLGLPKAGLGGLLSQFLGLEVDKAFQRADWRQRPLPPDMLEYARGDTRYLIPIWQILDKMLREQGLVLEAESAFLRTNQSPPQARKFNPQAFLQSPEARRLSAYHKARLRDLYRWRDDLARRLDEAVFRILPDGLMLPLSMFEGNAAELKAQFRHSTIRQHAQDIVEVLVRAADEPYRPEATPPPEPFLKGRQLARFEALRRWRNELAKELAIEPDRVVTNRILKNVVLQNPETLAELARVEGMEAWRMEKFGAALWSAVEPNR